MQDSCIELVEAFVNLLKDIEWEDDTHFSGDVVCPVCGHRKREDGGHAIDCERQLLMDKANTFLTRR